MISEVDRKHLRGDAAHAARNEVSLFLGRYKRRILEAAKETVGVWALGDHPEDYEADYGTIEGRKIALAAILDFINNAAAEARAEVAEAIAELEAGENG